MKKAKNLSIRAKLIMLILIITVGLLATALLGYKNYMKSNSALEDMYTNNLVVIEKLSDARVQSRGNYANILNLMITEDADGIAAIMEDFKIRSSKIETDFAEFAKIENTKDEKEQLALIGDNIVKWNTTTKKIIDLVSSGKSSEAITLFKSEGETIFEDLQTTIRDLESYNIKSAEELFNANQKEQSAVLIEIIIGNIFVSMVCIIFGVSVMFTITRLIRKVVNLIKKTSTLDLVYDKSYDSLLKRNDEIGIIAQEVENLRNVLRDMVGNVLSISTDLAASSEELAASTEENMKTIRQVVTAVNEIAEGNSVQAEMVEKTSETTGTMVSSINRVSRATILGSENAEKSMETIEEGQKAIDLTKDKMKENIKVAGDVGESIKELSNQMDKVGNIISVIKSISEQTNLLALNASIEAARAGEAGKGFAVVATEIGKLANNTASAVNEITEIIDDAISRSAVTAQNNDKAMGIVLEQEKAINITIDAFNNIKQAVADIAKRISKISESMSNIDTSSNEISKQMLDMSAVAQEAAASSEEISASNEEQLASIEMISSAATDLSKMASELNNEISRFKL